MQYRVNIYPSPKKLIIGIWCWVLITGAALQWWIIPATPWHAGDGLLAGGDWVTFQEQALRLVDDIQRYGWRAWELRYEGQAPASWAAAAYAITGVRQPWVLLPLHGLLYGIAVVTAVFIGRVIGIKGRLIWLILVPFLFPSSLLIYGQLHKDIFSLPGVLLIALGWVMAFEASVVTWRKITAIAVTVTAGILLCWWPRPYQAQLLIGVSVFLWFLSAGASIRRRSMAVGICAALALICAVLAFVLAERFTHHSTSSGARSQATQVCDTWQPEVHVPIISGAVADLFCFRHRFIYYYTDGGANIDHHRLLTNYSQVFAYLPRAIQIGLFAPFPSHWFNGGASPGGAVKRIFSGFEMLWSYGLLVGLIWVVRYRCCDFSIAALIVLSLVGILFYVYTSPNYGAIYRYRFPFFIIVLVVALAGWEQFIRKLHASRVA